MLLISPIVILILTAVSQILVPRAQLVLGISGSLAFLGCSAGILHKVLTCGTLVVQVGSWAAPFGITLVADLLSALMVIITALLGLAVCIFSSAELDPPRVKYHYYPLLSFLLLGVTGAFLAGDMFNLYVWFEIMLISSFVLMVLGGDRSQLEGGIKYVTLSLISSIVLLSSTGLLYHATGSLNMASLALRLREGQSSGLLNAIGIMLLVAFSIKAAVFPFFFWLPASYHTPPAAVSAIFAGLLTKVGVYSLIRVFTIVFPDNNGLAHWIIIFLANLTMVIGVLGAIAQNDMRRLLSFHIISQIGYMILGLGISTRLALAGTIFYVIHHILVKTTLFLVAGWVARIGGTYNLKKLGGFSRCVMISTLFLIPALSLAGIPPLSGFWAKLILIKAAFEAQYFISGASALVVSLLTLLSMTKIWNEVFWKPALSEQAKPPLSARENLCYMVPVAMLVTGTLVLSLGAGFCFEIANRAAEHLLRPEGYINAVFVGAKCS